MELKFRIHNLLLFRITFLTLFLGVISCTDDSGLQDSVNSGNEQCQDYELPGYINISLVNKSVDTRDDQTPSFGDGFKDGETYEYALATSTNTEPYHYVWLHNDNYGGTSVIPLDTRTRFTNTDQNITLSIRNIYTNKQISNNIKSKSDFISYLRGAKIYVLLNFHKSLIGMGNDTKTTKEILQEYQDISELQTSEFSITVSGVKYYTMTSAVYLDGNNIKTASLISDNISDRIYYKEEDALVGAPALTAYVDRLAVKIQFTDNEASPALIQKNSVLPNSTQIKLFNKLDEEYSYDYSLKDWTATVLGYGVNALESNEYLFKHLKQDEVFSKLSQPNVFRTYWAMDPNYSVKNDIDHYPMQYRMALENSDIRSHSNGYEITDDGKITAFPVKETDKLTYVSFYSLIDKIGTIYCLENTYNDSDPDINLGNKGYFSASTHLLVACRLNINGVSSNQLYRDQNDIFYTSATQVIGTKLSIMQNKYLPGGNSGLRVFHVDWKERKPFKADLITVSWNPGDRLLMQKEGESVRELSANDLMLIPAELTGGDGKVLVAPKDKNATYYIGKLTDKQEDLIELGYNRFVSLFYELLGAIDYYNKGYMYYAAPFPNAVNKLTSTSWKTPGDIGLVRNNWYTLKVSGVTAPGTPVAEERQPIIPMLDDKRSYIAVEATILDWHRIIVEDYPFLPGNDNDMPEQAAKSADEVTPNIKWNHNSFTDTF